MFNSKKNPIIYGTLLLSCSGLFCRGLGFFYHLFISRTFGEEAMGIFQLTSPILMLAFSLTGAGIQTAISKYTASMLAKSKHQTAHLYLLYGCLISLTLSSLYSLIIYCFSVPIAVHILGEKQCAVLLRICAFSFPLSSLHCCFNGYFYGQKNTKLPSLTQIAEQFIRIGSVLMIYAFYHAKNLVPSIAITCFGMLSGEAAALLLSSIYYLYSCKKTSQPLRLSSLRKNSKTFFMQWEIPKQLLSYSLPLTLNRVLVNLLQSYEAISLPAALKNYGYSTKAALSIYGVLTGMALSFVMFPSTFTYSVSVLLLPTVSEADAETNAKSGNIKLKKIIRRTVLFSFSLGFLCTLFFYFTGNYCGQFLFQSTLAGRFIKILSFLCPFLYLKLTLCSVLNGLKKTRETLWINLFSISLRLVAILWIVPHIGIYGYLYGLLLSDFLATLWCFYFLKKSIQLRSQ